MLQSLLVDVYVVEFGLQCSLVAPASSEHICGFASCFCEELSPSTKEMLLAGVS